MLLFCLLAVAQGYVFHYFGDPQIGFGTDGWEMDVSRFSQAASLAVSGNARRVPIAGDLVNSWNNQTQLDGFNSVWPSQFKSVPVDLVPGNHDVNSEASSGSDMLTELNAYRSRYGIDYHISNDTDGSVNIALIGIDSEVLICNFTELDDERNKQWSWLETQLKSIKNGTAAFLLMHHPPFITTEDEVDSYWNWPTQVRQQLLALVRQYKIQHLLCGHTHTTTVVVAADKAFTIYTVGGTARVFDDQGYGYRVFNVTASQSSTSGYSVNSVYVKLPNQFQSSEACVDVPAGELTPHPYFCI
jgi:3',5'-cyclic AMP phosphodiesterase CpdA